MWIYMKLLEAFLLNSLMKKEEYTVNHKGFNPIKVVIIFTLIANVGITVYVYTKLANIYEVVHLVCPNLIPLIEKGKNKQDIYAYIRLNEFNCGKEIITEESPIILKDYLRMLN